MHDLSALSSLQAAVVRRMTSDPALVERCNASLRERGVRWLWVYGLAWFVELAVLNLAFFEWDIDDGERPTTRLIAITGAIMTILAAGFFGFIAFVLISMKSWWWRAGLLLVIALIYAWEEYRDRRRRKKSPGA